MPTPLAKPDYSLSSPAPVAEPQARGVTALAQDGVAWAESPARLLHERLVATFAAPTPAGPDPALSPRARLAILAGSSMALWLLIGLAIAAVA